MTKYVYSMYHTCMIRFDCFHYKGSKPCTPHKESGVICKTCTVEYQPIKRKILIIKLGALGDVVRSTALLHQLKNNETHITWVTKPNAVGLLDNKKVDRILTDNDPVLTRLLHIESFDIVYGLDNDIDGASITTLANSELKYGYILNEHGAVIACDERSLKWLNVSLDDALKKKNKQSYQSVMFDFCHLAFNAESDTILLPSVKVPTKRMVALAESLPKDHDVWGIVVSAGKRWPQKGLSLDRLDDLIQLLKSKGKTCLLIGGRDDEDIILQCLERCPSVFRLVNNPSFEELIQCLKLCKRVVTGDTLSMHIAVGLGIKTYAFVGPTSSAELESYHQLHTFSPEMDCLCCYLTECPKNNKCNEIVTFDKIRLEEGW